MTRPPDAGMKTDITKPDTSCFVIGVYQRLVIQGGERRVRWRRGSLNSEPDVAYIDTGRTWIQPAQYAVVEATRCRDRAVRLERVKHPTGYPP
jgi:hypothetical protein